MNGLFDEDGCESGHCIQVPSSVGGNCKCKLNSECASGTCNGNWMGFSGDGGKCTAAPSSVQQGEACSKNDECASGVCEGNWHGAGSGLCAAGQRGTLAIGSECKHNQLCASNCCQGELDKNSLSHFHPFWKLCFTNFSINFPSIQFLSSLFFSPPGNIGGMTNGVCKKTNYCFSGLVRSAGKWMADVVRRGLAYLAQGMIKVLQWIIQAAQDIYNDVTATIASFQEKLGALESLKVNLNTQCPYFTLDDGTRSRIHSSMTPTEEHDCLALAESVATQLANTDMDKTMSTMKDASTQAKDTVCSNPGAPGNECSPPDTTIVDALSEWAPQYWSDALGLSAKFLDGAVHKVLDFQTQEYGYATDFGISIDAGFISEMWGVEDMTDLGPLLVTSVLSDIGASITSSVGWKGKNRNNWKNLNSGYTGDAFGVGASAEIPVLPPFSVEGGIALGIQSQYGCSFLDSSFSFVGHSAETQELLEKKIEKECPNPDSIGRAVFEVTNDVFNKMFVWDGTKTIGLSMGGGLDEDFVPDPNKAAVALNRIARRRRELQRTQRRVARVGHALTSSETVDEYNDLLTALEDLSNEVGATRTQILASLTCAMSEAVDLNQARSGTSTAATAATAATAVAGTAAALEEADVVAAIANIPNCAAHAIEQLAHARTFQDATPEERSANTAQIAAVVGYEIAVGAAATFVS